MTQALLTLPPTARRGDVVEIRALIAHAMESGFRPGNDGKTLPRDIVTQIQVRYDGAVVFTLALNPSIAANPYVGFHLRAVATAPVEVRWSGDNGFVHIERATLHVV